VAIFLPGALLVYASLPFWNMFREHPAFQRALSGINACVVGILLAALYLTIWTQTVHLPSDFGVVLVAFALLTVWKRPPWQVVILGAIAGATLGRLQ
jgi:chromate transporter